MSISGRWMLLCQERIIVCICTTAQRHPTQVYLCDCCYEFCRNRIRMGLCVPLVHVTIILLTKWSCCAQCTGVSASVLSALGSDLLCSVHWGQSQCAQCIGVRASVLSALESEPVCSMHWGQSQCAQCIGIRASVLGALGSEPVCSVHWGQSQCAQHIGVRAMG